MQQFSEQTQKSLVDAGWHPGRLIDVSKYVAAYENIGHPIFPLVSSFLEQFGGLDLAYPHFRNPDLVDSCNFRAELAAKIEPPWIREYEDYLGHRLVPIGAASREHMDLLMTAEGAIYATFEDLVCFVGDDYASALNALCEGQELECSNLGESKKAVASSDLADSVRQRLADAGWTSDRQTHLSVSACGVDGSDVAASPAVEGFLREYGKLRITTEPGGEFDINPAIANGTLREHQKREICSRLRVDAITPVGVAQPGAITVIMDEKGRMFGTMPGIPDWLVKYGDSHLAGLNAIVSGAGACSI